MEIVDNHTEELARGLKQPSEKIKALAAISLASKIGYLRLSDIVGPEDHSVYSLLDSRPSTSFKNGERIFPSDQARQLLCYLKKGLVDVIRTSNGQSRLITRLSEGVLFGEMKMLGQTMLGAQAVAAENCEVVFLNAADCEELIANSRGLAWRLARQLGSRLVEAEKRHERAAFQTVNARVAMLLLETADSENIISGVAQKQIAETLGVYRETVTVALADLKKAGLIEVGRRRIRLLDPDALRKMDQL